MAENINQNPSSPKDDEGITTEHTLDICEEAITAMWMKVDKAKEEGKELSVDEWQNIMNVTGTAWGLATDAIVFSSKVEAWSDDEDIEEFDEDDEDDDEDDDDEVE